MWNSICSRSFWVSDILCISVYMCMYYVMYSYCTHDVSWRMWSSKIVLGCLMRSVSVFRHFSSRKLLVTRLESTWISRHPANQRPTEPTEPKPDTLCHQHSHSLRFIHPHFLQLFVGPRVFQCLPRWSQPWYCSMVESWPWKDVLKCLDSVLYTLQSEGKKHLIMKSWANNAQFFSFSVNLTVCIWSVSLILFGDISEWHGWVGTVPTSLAKEVWKKIHQWNLLAKIVVWFMYK